MTGRELLARRRPASGLDRPGIVAGKSGSVVCSHGHLQSKNLRSLQALRLVVATHI